MKNLPTKILIRRIPPKLTEEKFLEMINPLPEYDYFRFCASNPNTDLQSFCRAYINFCDPQDVFQFSERFNDYVFVDDEGNESNAIVEYAVFQGTPTLSASGPATAKLNPQRVDKRQGTIDDDPDYKAFLQCLAKASISSIDPAVVCPPKDGDKKQTPWEAMLETIKQREENAEVQQKTTPLVAYINQRIERRKRNAVEDAKGSSGVPGQKCHSKSGIYRSSAKSRAQVSSRRMQPEFGRQRVDSRSSPMNASMGKDGTQKQESTRKLSECPPGNVPNNGGKRNIDSNRLSDKLVINRSTRKNKRRTTNEKDDINTKCDSGGNENTWNSAKQFEEDTEKREQTKSRSGRGERSNTYSGSQSIAVTRSSKSDRALDQRAMDGEIGVETAAKSVGRQWGGGNAGQRSQNSVGGSRYNQDMYDDDRGFPELNSRGGRSSNIRFTTSRSHRGAGRYPVDYSQSYSPKYEQPSFCDNDDQDSQQKDQPSRGGGPFSNRGFRSRGSAPRSSFTSSLRGPMGRSGYRS